MYENMLKENADQVEPWYALTLVQELGTIEFHFDGNCGWSNASAPSMFVRALLSPGHLPLVRSPSRLHVSPLAFLDWSLLYFHLLSVFLLLPSPHPLCAARRRLLRRALRLYLLF